eukprot:778217_1
MVFSNQPTMQPLPRPCCTIVPTALPVNLSQYTSHQKSNSRPFPQSNQKGLVEEPSTTEELSTTAKGDSQQQLINFALTHAWVIVSIVGDLIFICCLMFGDCKETNPGKIDETNDDFYCFVFWSAYEQTNANGKDVLNRKRSRSEGSLMYGGNESEDK